MVGGYEGHMTTPPCIPSYAGYRFPAEVISYAVYLYFRFPLSLGVLGASEQKMQFRSDQEGSSAKLEN